MYVEPEWSQETLCPGFFEVVKSGAVIERISIAKGTKLVSFGRLPDNTVPLDHESVSRNHAVVQFGPGNSAFLYDLGSTHGTFLNKQQVPALQYVKLTPENDIFYFGGSTRKFVLSLPPVAIKQEDETQESKDSGEVVFKERVLKFFEENGISQKEIELVNENGMFSCCLNYSEYISTDQEAVIVSSGTAKAEAFANFYEDSYNLLLRLGFISPHKSLRPTEIEEEDDDDDLSEPVKKKSKGGVVTEAELVSKRISLQAQMKQIDFKIAELKSSFELVKVEEVDDFDIYIKEAKLEQIQLDIQKCESEMSQVQKEFEECEAILKAIGHKESEYEIEIKGEYEVEIKSECEVEVEVEVKETLPIKHEPLSTKLTKTKQSMLKAKSEVKKPSANPILLQPTTKESSDEEEVDYNQFEDATDPNESTEQIDELKRKLGY